MEDLPNDQLDEYCVKLGRDADAGIAFVGSEQFNETIQNS